MRSFNRKFLPYGLLLPAFVVLFFVSFYTLITGLCMSFTDLNLIGGWQRAKWVGLENFVRLFHDDLFLHTFRNTFFWAGSVVGGQFLLGLGVALILNQKIKFRFFFRSIVLIPWVTHNVTVALTWRWILNAEWGLVNRYLWLLGLGQYSKTSWLTDLATVWPVLILTGIWKGFPFFYVNLLAGLQVIPNELYEAASLDGASKRQAFIYVTLPQLRHVIIIVTVLAIIWTWNNFGFIWAFTEGGPAHYTMVFPLLVYETSFQYYRLGYASAIATVMLLTMLVFSSVYFRSIYKAK